MNINAITNNTKNLCARIDKLQKAPNGYFTQIGYVENDLKALLFQMKDDTNVLNLLDDLIAHCQTHIDDVTHVAKYLMGIKKELPKACVINSEIDISNVGLLITTKYDVVFREMLKTNKYGCFGIAENKIKTLDKLKAMRQILFHDVSSAQIETRSQSFKF